ncbi:MAG: hypothetical protein HDS95_01070 [Bacteroidales bacterium]|nr:hypothetical protein [Bacteroidales bacterium]
MKAPRFIKEYRWIIITGLLACFIIAIIRFTDWRPLGYCTKADSVNYTLETISFSVLAAIIFWVVNDYSSYRRRRVIAVNHINRQIWTIKELIRQMVDAVEPFSLEQKNYSLESFKSVFNQKDLHEGFHGGTRKLVDIYTEYKNRIELIAEGLLASYSEYMTYDELKYFDELLRSYLIRNTISPMDFSIPIENRHFFPSNQEEIGESIYLLFKMKWPG